MNFEQFKQLKLDTLRDDSVAKLALELAEYMRDKGLLRSCVNCEHWSGAKTELCSLANQRPPATVIVTGCPAHTDNIPF